jgi:rhodanese-related sulfurtransferase
MQHLYHRLHWVIVQVFLPGGKTMDPSVFPETLMSLLKTSRPPAVVDVRKRPAFEADPAMLPGAVWRDPHAVERWAAELPSDCSIVVYCVHGHEVSRGVRDALRRRGVMASLIEGGIEGWRAAGGPVVTMREGDEP